MSDEDALALARRALDGDAASLQRLVAATVRRELTERKTDPPIVLPTMRDVLRAGPQEGRSNEPVALFAHAEMGRHFIATVLTVGVETRGGYIATRDVWRLQAVEILTHWENRIRRYTVHECMERGVIPGLIFGSRDDSGIFIPRASQVSFVIQNPLPVPIEVTVSVWGKHVDPHPED